MKRRKGQDESRPAAGEEENRGPGNQRNRPWKRKPTALDKAKEEFNRKKEEERQEKIRRQQDVQRRHELRKKREEERKLKQKLLSQKTKRGQPVMSGRIQLLVSKLEAQIGYKKP